MLIMHIGFLACFHAISLERQLFQQNRHILFLALVALKLLVSLISRLVACSPRIVVDTHTHTWVAGVALSMGCRCGSIETSWHTSVSREAVMSLTSLCLIDGYPPVGHDRACAMLNA